MTYSKVELKSNYDKASSCVKTFLSGNASDVDYLDSTIGFTEKYFPFFPAGHVIEILCIASE
jgi:hypothetical protein